MSVDLLSKKNNCIILILLCISVVNMEITLFVDVTVCCLLYAGINTSEECAAYILYAEMVVLGSSKVLVTFNQTLCCHIQEDGSPQLLNH